MLFCFFLFDVVAAAVNAGMYAWTHSPISLGAAVFCGLASVFQLVMLRDS